MYTSEQKKNMFKKVNILKIAQVVAEMQPFWFGDALFGAEA